MAKKSTPKEIPLHEVVLDLMFQENKERPAVMTITEVHRKLSNDTIDEINVSDVLTWLVAQKQVVNLSGKYALDRYEFLEQRSKDRTKRGEKIPLVTDENPLHDIILQLMFEANKERPAQLTIDDIFWKVSDPKVHDSLVGDVLKWLQNQGRIEYLSGKYSLDQIEFQDQHNLLEKASKVKMNPKKEKGSKPEPKLDETKIVIPDAPKEEKDKKKAVPKKKVEKAVEPKKPELKKTPIEKPEMAKPTPVRVEPKKTVKNPIVEAKAPEKKVEPVVEVPSTQKSWKRIAVVLAIACLIYSLLIVFSLYGLVSDKVSPDSFVSRILQLFFANGLAIVLLAVTLFKRD